MIELSKITGRLGNQLFLFAFAYNYARQCGIDRYFQDPIYFRESEGEIKFILQQGIPERTDMVAIHYRQGDYVNNPLYTNLSETSYYDDAMALFPDEDFLVFSDDIEKAKEFFIGKQFYFSEGRNEIDDFNLMASCKHQIIANSSFSLWCGILNPNPNKKVICPQEDKYYSDGVIRTKYPDYFTQLNFNDNCIK